MGLSDHLRGDSGRIEGEIGYFGLADWWLSTFSAAERAHVESVFQPLGSPPGNSPLTSGKIVGSSGTAGGLLGSLAGWFKKRPEDLDLALRILAKAEERSASENDVLSLHFAYQERIQLNYRWRDHIPGTLDAAGITACRQQIAVAPKAAAAFRREYPGRPLPMHIGYEQLAIILEKQGKYPEAISLCREAQSRQWTGTWEKRIARMEARQSKGAS